MAVPLTSIKRGVLHNFRHAPKGLQTLLQRRIVGVQLFKLRQQDLNILQLAGLLPIVDQQHPCLAVGGVALDNFLQLFQRRFHFLLGMQGGRQVIAVMAVLGLQFHRFCQPSTAYSFWPCCSSHMPSACCR